jgi:hypothetical protein
MVGGSAHSNHTNLYVPRDRFVRSAGVWRCMQASSGSSPARVCCVGFAHALHGGTFRAAGSCDWRGSVGACCLECEHPSQGFVVLAQRRAAWWAFHLNNELCQVLLLSRKLDKQLVLLRLFPLSGCRGANRLDVGVAIAVVGTCMWRWAKVVF